MYNLIPKDTTKHEGAYDFSEQEDTLITEIIKWSYPDTYIGTTKEISDAVRGIEEATEHHDDPNLGFYRLGMKPMGYSYQTHTQQRIEDSVTNGQGFHFYDIPHDDVQDALRAMEEKNPSENRSYKGPRDLFLFTITYASPTSKTDTFLPNEWITKDSLEKIITNKVSNRKQKNILHLGKRHLINGKGDVNKITKEEQKLKETYKDLFLCIKMEKHPSLQIEDRVAKRYHKEHNRIFKGLEHEGELNSYDAKSLDSGRGKYRFIFKDNMYKGIATHTKSSGKQYMYRWV